MLDTTQLFRIVDNCTRTASRRGVFEPALSPDGSDVLHRKAFGKMQHYLEQLFSELDYRRMRKDSAYLWHGPRWLEQDVKIFSMRQIFEYIQNSFCDFMGILPQEKIISILCNCFIVVNLGYYIVLNIKTTRDHETKKQIMLIFIIKLFLYLKTSRNNKQHKMIKQFAFMTLSRIRIVVSNLFSLNKMLATKIIRAS